MTTLTQTAHRVNPPREIERASFWDYSQHDVIALLSLAALVAMVLFAILLWIDNCPEQLRWLINFGR